MPNDGDIQEGPHVPEAVLTWIGGGRAEPMPPEVRAWLAEAPSHRTVLEELVRVWDLSRAPAPPAELSGAVRRRIGRPAAPARATAPPRSARWLTPLRAAALVVLGLGLGLLWPVLRRGAIPTADAVAIHVPAGATSVVELPGDITVRLNSVSRLSYAPAAGRIDEVRLEGEAYFDVPHDPSREFRVRTAHGVIRDIGTEFNVRARDGQVSVAVVEGEVELAAAGEAVAVTAGQSASAAANAPPTSPRPINLAAAVAWTEGRLVFYDEPLERIADELERRFDIRVRIAPALRQVRLTATIAPGSGRSAAVRLICQAIDARCERDTNTWIIRPGS